MPQLVYWGQLHLQHKTLNLLKDKGKRIRNTIFYFKIAKFCVTSGIECSTEAANLL